MYNRTCIIHHFKSFAVKIVAPVAIWSRSSNWFLASPTLINGKCHTMLGVHKHQEKQHPPLFHFELVIGTFLTKCLSVMTLNHKITERSFIRLLKWDHSHIIYSFPPLSRRLLLSPSMVSQSSHSSFHFHFIASPLLHFSLLFHHYSSWFSPALPSFGFSLDSKKVKVYFGRKAMWDIKSHTGALKWWRDCDGNTHMHTDVPSAPHLGSSNLAQ